MKLTRWIVDEDIWGLVGLGGRAIATPSQRDEAIRGNGYRLLEKRVFGSLGAVTAAAAASHPVGNAETTLPPVGALSPFPEPWHTSTLEILYMSIYNTNMASKALRSRILDALGQLLAPIVLMLLRSGITWREFADVAKVKFVQVATNEFGIRGRPTNASRVAILTGIDRREVSKVRQALREQPDFDPGFMSKPTLVLDGWFHDPRFRTALGTPRDLRVDEGDDSFAALVRRYAPAIPHVAMIKELRSAGAIEELPDGRLRALKRNYIPRELSENQIRLWGSVLQDLGTTFEHNVSRDATDPPRFERRAISLRVDPRALPEFREMLEREGQAFLERIDDWITAHEVGSTADPRDPGIRLGVGVYHIQNHVSRLRGIKGAMRQDPQARS